MDEDSYEILPQRLVADLRDEVEGLKKKLNQPDSKMQELILEIESIKDTIHDLQNVFQRALEETKDDDVSRTISVMKERVETILNQNETIAKGMIAISDKLEDFMSRQGQKQPDVKPMSFAPNQHTMGMSVPPTFGAGRMAPPMEMPAPEMSSDFPPPPPGANGKKRRGLF